MVFIINISSYIYPKKLMTTFSDHNVFGTRVNICEGWNLIISHIPRVNKR